MSIVLAFALLGVLFSVPAVAQENDSDLYILQLRAGFNEHNPPEAPYHAHQSMLLFAPGAEAPLHSHGGPGYITILQGELTLYEDGEENTYQAGDSLVEMADKHYRGGNYTDEDTVLMVTYLVPDGEDITTMVDDPDAPEPPELSPEPLAESMHMFTDPPDSFELIHMTAGYEPGATSGATIASGEMLLTVVTGDLDVTMNGDTETVNAGGAILIEADQEFSLHNGGDTDVLIMSTELASDIHGIVPATGSAVDRTFAMWLIVLTASALLVVGGVLRLTEVRMR